MYVRLTKTVRDKGRLVTPEELAELVEDYDIDWYYSPFMYGEDALDYFEENDKSIKGYTGEAFTNVLYWDLDCKADFGKVQENAIKLIDYLVECGFGDGIELYFSGNKGVHVLLNTENKCLPQQVKKICYNVAVEADLDQEVFDTSVYNVNRIFRIPFTKHQDSGLYKVPLTYEQLCDLSEEEVRSLAETNDYDPIEFAEVDAAELIEEFGQIIAPSVTDDNNVIDLDRIREKYGSEFNPLDCPPDKRRCIYVLENGYFGHGERENASIRLAAYYMSQGENREQVENRLYDALKRREAHYTDLNQWEDADVQRILNEVFSENWNGGAYSCRTDEFLRSKCDVGSGCCADDKSHKEKLNVVTVGGLIDRYLDYANQALMEYPEMGIKWLDEMIRIRPRNFSIVNGANGSGKTSLVIQFMENLNRQQMWHLFFSLDMADTSLFEKLGAKYTEYSQEEIESAFNIHTRDEKIMAEVLSAIREKLPYTLFDFTSSVDSRYIEHTISTLKRREIDPVNIQVAIIDYAGRITGDKDSEYANATDVALRANDICKRTNTHLMFISQVPRDEGDHTLPLRSSRVSKNSGAWEENATIVVNCWRPFGDGIARLDKYMHIYIAKNRSGTLGERVFSWEGKTGTVSDISKSEFIEYSNLCSQHNKQEPYQQFDFEEVDEERIAKTKAFKTDGGKKRGTTFNMKEEDLQEEDYDEENDEGRTRQPRTKRFGRSKKFTRVSKK